MSRRSRSNRSMHLRLAAAGTAMSLVSGLTAQASLLFDNMSAFESHASGANATWTTSTPNSFMGDGYVLSTGATDLTGVDLFPVNASTTNYTGLQISVYIWGNVNTGTVNSSSPAFSNLLGSFALNSPGTYTKGNFYYPFEGSPAGAGPGVTFNTPVQLNGATTIGITINYEGTTNGSTYQNANNLTSLISYGVAPAVGSNLFNGYYRNMSLETTGNFISSLKTLNGSPTNQSVALRIFGDVASSTGSWTSNSGGDWNSASNWSTSAVPTSGADVAFNRSSSNYTVTVSSAATCENLQVRSDNVTLDMSAASSSLAIGGALTVGEPAVAGSNINGVLNLTDSYGGAPVNISAGSVVSGGDAGTGVLTIGSGVRLISSGAVFVAAGSSIVISPGGKLMAPSISITGTTNAWTGLVDIGTSALDLSSATLATVINQIKQGFNGGAWNGTGGIISSAAANTSHLTAVGVIANNDGNGNPLYGSGGALGMFGSSSPGLNDVLVRYTYFGDANLDGKVDGSDYSLIDNGYLNHLTGWFNGDLNYDNVVDGSDYTLIDNTFNSQGMNLVANAIVAASPTALVAPGITAVPEPASLGVLTISVVSLLVRRSDRSTPSRDGLKRFHIHPHTVLDP